MAAFSFSSYTEALEAFENQLSGEASRVGSVSVGGDQITYRSNADFLNMLRFIEQRAALEQGTMKFRHYAKQGGRD
jgi:hypothetical protein